MSELAQYRRPMRGTQPEYQFDAYGSTHKRAPSKSLILLPQTLSEITGPVFGHDSVKQGDNDLTQQEPQGERITISGRVLDENGRVVPYTLIEIWQANAAGRYAHKGDQHDAPLDANFTGAGRAMTDSEGRYSFTTIKPGAYPWRTHFNAWRPAHIHFSLFGPAFATRLVTQMYFPNDPLLAFDPIYNCTPDVAARRSMVSSFDWETTQSERSLGYRFDIVLRGRNQTMMEK